MGSISVSGTESAAPTAGWAASALRAIALAGVAVASIGASPVSTLDVGIDALRSTKGQLRLCLTRQPDAFPDCVGDRDAIRRTIPAGDRATRFDGLSPGGYAIAVIHDENGNARLDTFAGIPREGFGFSRNPPIAFGPPRFSAARFTIDGDAARQQVKMRYML